MTIPTQFGVDIWINKLNNLLEGADAAIQLAQHVFQTSELHPINIRYLASFDERCRFDSGTHKQDNLRESINTTETDREVKKYSSNWVPANKGDNTVKGTTCKEKEVFIAAGMRGKKFVRLTGF